MKNIKTILILSMLTSIFLCSCGGDTRDFSSYTPSTDYCTSELDQTSSGMNKVCNLNKVKTSKNTSVNAFNSNLIYTLFPYEKLTLDDVYKIENIVGEKMISLHKDFDRHNSYLKQETELINNLKTINDSYGTGESIKVSEDLFNILKLSLELGDLSDGKFNIAIGELSDFWNDLIEENRNGYDLIDPDLVRIYNPSIPEDELIKQEQEIQTNLKLQLDKILKNTPSSDELKDILILDENSKTVCFNKYKDAEKVSLSLGAIGKGYAVDIIASNLIENNLTYGYISGATSSNVILGNHYKNSGWTIGISSPSSNDFNLGGKLSLNGYNVISTSGDEVNSYAFYDENNNVVRRHHIIDAKTGYPLYNFRKVTIVSKTLNAGIMDALSTILVNTSLNDMENVLNSLRTHYNADIEAIFQDSNANETEYYYYVTKGLKDIFEVNKDNPIEAKVTYYEF